MRYVEPVYRPPSEASSYILQVTYGCTHNRCTFCAMYRNKRFAVRPFAEVEADLREAALLMPDTRRVFLADGDALVLSPKRLNAILDLLASHFPRLQRVSAYADAKSLLQKSRRELQVLKNKGLRVFYMGLESGNEEVLRRLDKESTAAAMTDAVLHAHNAGMKSSIIVLLGAGGVELSAAHAADSARVLSAMSPHYSSALTLTVVPGTPLAATIEKGGFQPISPLTSLEELRTLVAALAPSRGTIFRANHASSYLPLGGVLPRDRAALLRTIDRVRASGDLKPEWLRGL
jgi:radical SAM superfamily enzyme YgiQ (UPF0313 family)